jgi:hypothetical protein
MMETGTRHPSPGSIQPAHGPISLRTCSTVEHSLCPRGHSSVVVAPAPYVAGRPAAGSRRPCRLLLSAASCQGMGMGVLAGGRSGRGVRMRPRQRAAFELRKAYELVPFSTCCWHDRSDCRLSAKR